MTDNIEIVREADKIKTPKFPKNAPSRVEIQNIVQIDYHFGQTAPARHLMHIKASNNLQAVVYPWRFLPRYYESILALMFFRLEFLKKAATDRPDSGGDATHIKCAQRCLANLDSVLDILWEDARIDYDNERMDDTWRDATFERWLCIEIMIGNHAPEAVEQWIALDPQNKDALDRGFGALNWENYRNGLPEDFDYKNWNYSMAAVKQISNFSGRARDLAKHLYVKLSDDSFTAGTSIAAVKKRQRNDVDDLDAMNIDNDVLTQAADKSIKVEQSDDDPMQDDDVVSRRSARKPKGKRSTRRKPKKSKLTVETVEPESEDVGQSGGNTDSVQVPNTASGSEADETAGEPFEPTRAHTMATRSRGRVRQEVEKPSPSNANDSDDFDFLAPLLQKKESGAAAITSRAPSVKSSTHASRASSVAARSNRSRNKSSRSASVAVDIALQGEEGDGVDNSNDTPMKD